MTVFELQMSTSRSEKKSIFPVYSGSDTKSEDIVDACREILTVYLQGQQLPVADLNFWNYSVSENKLCSIFVANAIIELSEGTTSIAV